MVPYVDAVVAVTVMRVLLFESHVCMLKECAPYGYLIPTVYLFMAVITNPYLFVRGCQI